MKPEVSSFFRICFMKNLTIVKVCVYLLHNFVNLWILYTIFYISTFRLETRGSVVG
jgi:hypothetical protein